MASIFDPDQPDLPTKQEERSKKRESITSYEASKGKRRLYDMVEAAFETLEQATKQADWGNAVKAATAILDRAGFGPKTSIDVTTHHDLSHLSNEELAERAKVVLGMIEGKAGKRLPVIDLQPQSRMVQ